MEILKIRGIGDTRGSMEIAMYSFFPCNKTKLRKLLKIIAISEQPQEAVDKIKTFLPKQLEHFELLKKQAQQNEAKRLFNQTNKAFNQCKMNIEFMNEVIT